jgi:uncharacterized coiled-coil DUF342 family protein
VADLGRTYKSKRTADHMTSEASRLREMVQEREEEIDRLHDQIAKALSTLRGASRLDDLVDEEIKPSDLSQAIHELQVALDGGGGPS